jgi:hypothetical protein
MPGSMNPEQRKRQDHPLLREIHDAI